MFHFPCGNGFAHLLLSMVIVRADIFILQKSEEFRFVAFESFYEPPGIFVRMVLNRNDSLKPVIEPGFGNQEINEALGVLLGFQHGSGEIEKPVCDVQILTIVLKGRIVGLPVPADCLRQRDERRSS